LYERKTRFSGSGFFLKNGFYFGQDVKNGTSRRVNSKVTDDELPYTS
jgi:hypothetical protein